MKLFEYEGRELFMRYGIVVPRGMTVTDADEAAQAVKLLGGAGVIKAQTLSGSRGKAGVVRMVHGADEARAAARALLSMTIAGCGVEKLLVEELLDIEQEAYLSLMVDRSIPGIRCIASALGGEDIERIALRSPSPVHSVALERGDGPEWEACSSMLDNALGPEMARKALSMAGCLYRLCIENDCLLAEINPLARTHDGSVVAADAKVTADDNALWRHEKLREFRDREETGADEAAARAAGLSFVALEGTIGCIVNGAGLAMATMDTIKLMGGEPANFLDVGGSSNPDKIMAALQILLRTTRIRVILINIFGGITRCDDIAEGILMARRRLAMTVPMVIRLIGTNEEAGRALLEGEGLKIVTDMTEAVNEAVVADRRFSGDMR
jgi:succinyl-CoA synthetase beta subunit